MVEMRALGTVELRSGEGGEPIASLLSQPMRLGLFAYLLLARPSGRHDRETLSGLFWPDLSPTRARRALSQALYVLRRELGEEVFVGRRAIRVGINPSHVRCDALEFRTHLEGQVDDGARERALALYRGELLKGFFVPGCGRFETWLEEERAYYFRLACDAAWSLAESHEAAGRGTEAARWAVEAARHDPLDERVHERLLRLLERTGAHAMAWSEFDAFTARLSRELDEEPSERTRTLARRIRAAASAADEEPASTGAPSVAPRPTRVESPEGAGVPPARVTQELDTADRTRAGRRSVIRWLPLVAAVVILTWGAIALADFGTEHSPEPLLPARVLVTPLRNGTDDPGLTGVGDLVADWTTQALSRLDGVRLVALPERARLAAALAELPESRLLDTLRALAGATDATLIIEGRLSRGGNRRWMHVRALRTSGEVVGAVGPIALPPGDPTPGVREISARVAGLVARGGAHAPGGPLWDGWAPHIDAWREFVVAGDAVARSDLEQILEHYGRAAALDTGFVLPVLELAAVNQLVGRKEAADSLFDHVERRRDRLSRVDRLRLNGLLARGEDDSRSAYEAWKAAARLAPDLYGDEYLSAALWMGRYREVVREARALETAGLVGDEVRFELAMANHALGNHEVELRIARREGAVDDPDPDLNLLVPALVALGRIDEVESLITEALSDYMGRFRAGSLMRLGAREAYAHAREEDAVRLAEAAIREFEEHRILNPDSRGTPVAEAYYLAGRLDEAERSNREMLEAPRSPWKVGLRAAIGTIAARRGDVERALEADRALAAEPQDPEVLLWRARIAALLGDREAVVEFMRNAIARGLPHWSFRTGAFEFRHMVGYPPFDELLGEGGL